MNMGQSMLARQIMRRDSIFCSKPENLSPLHVVHHGMYHDSFLATAVFNPSLSPGKEPLPHSKQKRKKNKSMICVTSKYYLFEFILTDNRPYCTPHIGAGDRDFLLFFFCGTGEENEFLKGTKKKVNRS